MKHQAMELHFSQSPRTPKIVFTITITLIILAIISLHYPLSGNPIFGFSKYYSSPSPEPSSPSSLNNNDADQGSIKEVEGSEKCDIFSGEWVPNPEGPYYTNTTCWAIHEHQNCMKYGRPDTDFMKWRWKPDGCELPIFNPSQFLEIVRGKSMAFVGDSVARNQMQSLICLLSRVKLSLFLFNYQPIKFYPFLWYFRFFCFFCSFVFSSFATYIAHYINSFGLILNYTSLIYYLQIISYF